MSVHYVVAHLLVLFGPTLLLVMSSQVDDNMSIVITTSNADSGLQGNDSSGQTGSVDGLVSIGSPLQNSSTKIPSPPLGDNNLYPYTPDLHNLFTDAINIVSQNIDNIPGTPKCLKDVFTEQIKCAKTAEETLQKKGQNAICQVAYDALLCDLDAACKCNYEYAHEGEANRKKQLKAEYAQCKETFNSFKYMADDKDYCTKIKANFLIVIIIAAVVVVLICCGLIGALCACCFCCKKSGSGGSSHKKRHNKRKHSNHRRSTA